MATAHNLERGRASATAKPAEYNQLQENSTIQSHDQVTQQADSNGAFGPPEPGRDIQSLIEATVARIFAAHYS